MEGDRVDADPESSVATEFSSEIVNTSALGGDSTARRDYSTRTEPEEGGTSKTPEFPSPYEIVFIVLAMFLADFMVYVEPGGTGFGLAVLLWTTGFLFLSRTRFSMSVTPLFIFLFLLGLRHIYDTGFLPVLVTFAVAGLLAPLARWKKPEEKLDHWLDAPPAGVWNFCVGWVRMIEYLVGAVRLLRYWRPEEERGERKAVSLFGLLFRALLIFFVFGLIFIKANPVVEEGWSRFIEFLKLEIIWKEFIDFLFQSPFRIFSWIVAAWLTTAFLRPCHFPRVIRNVFGEDDGVRPSQPESEYDAIELDENRNVEREYAAWKAIVTLGAGALIFFLYNVVDFTYLFAKGTLPEGMTDSEYAKRGAGWLTFALILSTFMILPMTNLKKFPLSFGGKIKTTANIWLVMQIVMSVLVIGRIHFYIDDSGLTPLRIVGIIGTLAVISGILILFVKVHNNHGFLWISRCYTVVFISSIVFLTVCPLGNVSAAYNVHRVFNGDNRPLMLLFTRHTEIEAVPTYSRLLDHPDPRVSEGIAAWLYQKGKRDGLLPVGSDPSIREVGREVEADEQESASARGEVEKNWREFQLGRYLAGKRLRAEKSRLNPNENSLFKFCGEVWQGDCANSPAIRNLSRSY